MSQTVVVLSKTVIDISLELESFPVLPDLHQTIRHKVVTPGGPANVLLCGARLGLKMVALATAGADAFGHLWVERVASEGVDTTGVIYHDHEPTPLTVVLSAPEGNHVFLAHRGEFNSGPKQFPAAWIRQIQAAAALYVDGYNYRAMGSDVNLTALEIARVHNIPVFFDPGPEIPLMTPEWLAAMFQGTTVALLTCQEARAICGEELEPEGLAGRILQLGPELVLLKMGADGIIAHSRHETMSQPGFAVPVRDATGAGDSVTAAVLLSYLKGYSLGKLLLLANATGAAAVQKLGAGINVPHRHEVEAVLRQAGLPVDF